MIANENGHCANLFGRVCWSESSLLIRDLPTAAGKGLRVVSLLCKITASLRMIDPLNSIRSWR
jgi:hypothetical protein